MTISNSITTRTGLHAADATHFTLIPARRSSYVPRGRSGLVALDAGRHADRGASTATRTRNSFTAVAELIGLAR